MKKKYILIGSVAFALFVAAAFNVTIKSDNMKISDFEIANIKALSKDEGGNEAEGHGCSGCYDYWSDAWGIKYYCQPGTGGCIYMPCSSGIC